MSSTPIDRSPDLTRLRQEGFNIQITNAGNLIVRDVPYVNAKREIAYGILASDLELAGDITTKPERHVAKFVGSYPCDANGQELAVLRHQSGSFDLGSGVVAQHSFSRRPPEGYSDYHEKMTAYISLLGQHVAAIDPYATAQTRRVIEPESEDSPFNYLDTASARAEINPITAKLAEEVVDVVGAGGTASYLLDFLAKTPSKKINIYDGDRFLTHNAFRAPGAPSIEELRTQPYKVDYLAKIYSNMHRGIVPHAFCIDETNVDRLQGSFVFLCMEGGKAKRAIIEKLEARATPYIDVGIGLQAVNGKLTGGLRSVLSLPDAREPAKARISFASDNVDNEYDKNIQVADLNAFNACLAVMMWKKYRGFYADLGHERFLSFMIAGSVLNKGDIV